MAQTIKIILLLIIINWNLSSFWPLDYVGGYCGNSSTAPSVVYNFIKYFDYDQYYWASYDMLCSFNDYYIDWEDISYYYGYGSPYIISVYKDTSRAESTNIDLRYAGSSYNLGWGERFAKYVVLHASCVIPSRLDTSDWEAGWKLPSSVWRGGVRMILGFRTKASVENAAAIAKDYGNRIKNGGYVFYGWLNAISANSNHSNGCDYGSIIWHPGTNYDKYPNNMSDWPDDSLIYNTYQY